MQTARVTERKKSQITAMTVNDLQSLKNAHSHCGNELTKSRPGTHLEQEEANIELVIDDGHVMNDADASEFARLLFEMWKHSFESEMHVSQQFGVLDQNANDCQTDVLTVRPRNLRLIMFELR